MNRLKSIMLGAAGLILCGCASSFQTVDRPTSQAQLEWREAVEQGQESGAMLIPIRSVTADGIALLKLNEGEVRCKQDPGKHCPYNDSSDYCTVGHGHLVAKAACEDIRTRLKDEGYLEGISDELAEEILVSDLRLAQIGIERHLDSEGRIGITDLTDAQYDALVSFVFNIGVGGFNTSTLLQKIKEREQSSGSAQVAYQFSRWRKSNGEIVRGLVNRRRREVAHFFTDFTEPYVDWERTATESGGGSDDDFIDLAVGERDAAGGQ